MTWQRSGPFCRENLCPVVTVELIWLLFLNIVFPSLFKRQRNILGLEDLEEAMYTTLL